MAVVEDFRKSGQDFGDQQNKYKFVKSMSLFSLLTVVHVLVFQRTCIPKL